MTNSNSLSQNLKQLSDDVLLKQTQEKAAQERMLTAEVLKMLQEIDKRKLYAARGFSSLFSFCVEYLNYSEGAAQRRVSSVRLLNEMPELEVKIREGSLTLSNVAQAQSFFQAEAKYQKPLSTEDKKAVLVQLENKSSRQAERQLIALSSHPDDLTSKETIRPVTSTHFEMKFFATQELLDQIEEVKGLLSHKYPSMNLAELMTELARIALEKLRPKAPPLKDEPTNQNQIDLDKSSKQAMVNLPAPAIRKPVSRYIPVKIKSAVYYRDHGSCAFIDLVSGRRCSSKRFIQYHHLQAFAKGGEHSIQNIELRCFAHNSYHSIQDFGLENREERILSRKNTRTATG